MTCESQSYSQFNGRKTHQSGTDTWVNDKGQLHRLDGPAVARDDGYKAYYVNGELHRLDGPALYGIDGYNVRYHEYWVNGKRHRIDGPAIIWPDKSKEYWLNGTKVTKENLLSIQKSCEGNMKDHSKLFSKIICQEKGCQFTVNVKQTTYVAYIPVYDERGNNINPDLNDYQGIVSCNKCQASWLFEVSDHGETITVSRSLLTH